VNTEPPPGLDPIQQRIWEALSDQARHIDDLIRALELPVAQVSQALLLMEMKKGVRRLPGNMFERR
jgi:DNA processing protein